MHQALLTTKSQFDRVLMKETDIEKEKLEVEILSWMPLKVSNSC